MMPPFVFVLILLILATRDFQLRHIPYHSARAARRHGGIGSNNAEGPSLRFRLAGLYSGFPQLVSFHSLSSGSHGTHAPIATAPCSTAGWDRTCIAPQAQLSFSILGNGFTAMVGGHGLRSIQPSAPDGIKINIMIPLAFDQVTVAPGFSL